MPKYTVVPTCQIPNLADIYERYFSQEGGTFVEVGAYDGRVYSNTCTLADAGWIGHYIEAHPDYARVCRQYHQQNPQVQVWSTAISDFVGEADLYIIGECSTLVFNGTAQAWGGDKNRKVRVPVTTMDLQLGAMGVSPHFELLVVDVEGSELALLKGFTVAMWLPRMVIIEAHEHDNCKERNAKAGPINAFFEAAGYAKIQADAINSIFVTKDRASA